MNDHMLYDVVLKITYEYENTASGGRQVLRLMPAHIEGRQNFISGSLDISPKLDERNDRLDFFNNALTEVAFQGSYDEIIFHVKARIECLEQVQSLNIAPTLDGLKREIASVTALDFISPHHFMGQSQRVRINQKIKEFALSYVQDAMTVVEIVEAIGKGLYKVMKFDAEATTVDTPMEEAFEKKHGVCQDYTHIMIACLRSIGIPAGYVSGYIRTIPAEGEKRLEGADAMHAWVRAWAGHDCGWIEFDPTNNKAVNTDHIVIAYGRDYDDIAPVKGIMKTYGASTTKQGVDVIPIVDKIAQTA
jgi:transglutaminase-like putative cysteine protease